jgi:hypothetical protein
MILLAESEDDRTPSRLSLEVEWSGLLLVEGLAERLVIACLEIDHLQLLGYEGVHPLEIYAIAMLKGGTKRLMTFLKSL